MKNIDVVIKFLSYLNLGFEESKVYLALLDKGASTILELSRATKISRTNVYRLIDILKENGFVEESSEGSKRLFHPVGMHKLEMLVKEQESKAEFLRNIFPEISTIIPASNSISQPDTKVLFYKGEDGIKQMLWNTLNAKSECFSYTFNSFEELVGKDFLESWIREYNFRRLKFRDLIGNAKILKNGDYSERFETRFITPDVMTIDHQRFIYGDVVAYFDYSEGQLFGVEIYNKKNAKLQKQLFEIVWRLGVEI